MYGDKRAKMANLPIFLEPRDNDAICVECLALNRRSIISEYLLLPPFNGSVLAIIDPRDEENCVEGSEIGVRRRRFFYTGSSFNLTVSVCTKCTRPVCPRREMRALIADGD